MSLRNTLTALIVGTAILGSHAVVAFAEEKKAEDCTKLEGDAKAKCEEAAKKK